MIKFIKTVLITSLFLAFLPLPNQHSKAAAAQSSKASTVLKNIKFRVKAVGAEKKYFPNGLTPWISIKSPTPEIKRLVGAQQKVITQSTVYLVIDYPVSTKATFKLTSKQGFTRAKLALLISQKYHQMFTVEESTATVKTIPLKQRKGLINRNKTNGKYGIWGHDIGDLVLTDLDVVLKGGRLYLHLGVDS